MTAHAGHWATSLLYLAPVVGLVGFLAVQSRRERRSAAAPDRVGPPQP